LNACAGESRPAPFPREERKLVPPICLHLGIAKEAVARLWSPILNENQGSFYLGSTAPDIRYFIDATREETHFLSLDGEDRKSGVEAMFAAHPELNKDADLNDATRSFVAGYLSHLVTDEAWIRLVYRPYFGESSPLGGAPEANLLDRLLQYELDRQERLDNVCMSAIRAQLNDSAAGVAVSFIDGQSLERWREFVFMASTRKSSWEDFRRFAEKYLMWMRQIAPEKRDKFFGSFDDRLAEVLRMVSQERLQSFREKSVVDSVKVALEYLE
jgi:hypothetical protein